MPLFQNSVLNQYLKQLDKNEVETAYISFKNHFHNTTIQQQIRESKEEQYQEGFFRDLFVEVLGYTLNPKPNFNLITEQKNEANSKKADGAILNGSEVLAVIELKGTNTTDLNTVTNQAFNYKNNQKNCKYVIISNFEKLRLYIDNAIDFEEFNLFSLTAESFSLLYLCLKANHLLSDLPQKIKQASTVKEENVTKQLYKDYSDFKQKLFRDIVHLNPQYDKLILFKKSQKLLDRILFILFAEDRGLIQANTVHGILDDFEKLKKLDAYLPLYDRFKKHFKYLNEGFKNDKYEVFGYNGGLFARDEILDNIIITDNLLQNYIPTLSKYDYETEVDVNILGHIFEHSLNDIDEIQAELEGKTIDKTKTKRKKDGVFYTPKYIAKYIVENTIGALCIEKRNQYGIVEDNYTPDKRKAKKKELLEIIDTYQKWLLDITIVDPACGSGAFLNQALDYLIQEHKNIDELRAQLLGHSFVLPDHEVAILENNIFGVDLNEESVEIARLSLWLRTAQKGRKLNSLNSNIKCGNSLIDDVSVAGVKAFNWQLEFPNIFEQGGFDVVIGNPPYVRQELFKDIKPYFEINYKCYNSIADLYTYFIEKGIRILNSKGKFSFILPNKFLKASYGKEIRNVISNNTNIEIIFDFDDYPVFDDATTYPLIFVLNKNLSKNNTFKYSEINKRICLKNPIELLQNNSILISTDSIKLDNWNLVAKKSESIIAKLNTNTIPLKSYVDDKIFRGVSTGKNEVFIIDNLTAQNIRNEKNKNHIRKIVTGKEVKRYSLEFADLYLLFIPWDYDIEFDDNIKKYLFSHQEVLKERPEVKEGRFNWWCLSRYGSKNVNDLFKPKIIYPRINRVCNFYLDNTYDLSLSDNNFFISCDSYYLLSLLNSTLTFFFLKSISSTLQGGFFDFRRPYIEQIPIKQIPLSDQKPFISLAEIMLQKNKELQSIKSSFIKLIQSRYSVININTKLGNWNDLTFKDFYKELEKQKIKLTLSEQAELMQYFEQEQNKTNTIQQIIKQTDKEIDQMVYKLYELTPEEIVIVEES